MNITEIRVKMIGNNAERLKAFCSITLDGDFVIRDLKVIDGVSGFFVAMPSRKLSDRCQKCGSKNHLRARFCNDCGAKLDDSRADHDGQGRAKLHADVAHPINATCRERLQQAVIEAFEEELGKSQEPGYEPAVYDDDDVIERKTHEATEPEPSESQAVDEDVVDEDDTGVSDDDTDLSDNDGDDFESLIAGLKQDAAARRAKRDGDSGNRREDRREDRRPPQREDRRPPQREQRRAPVASVPDEPAEPDESQETDDFLAGLTEPEKKPEPSRPAASSRPLVEPKPEPVQVQPAAATSDSHSAADQDEKDEDGFSDGLL